MLVLASQSPRRREILARAGIEFVVKPAAVSEAAGADEDPREHVMRLARTKAEMVPAAPDQVVLGADTVVVVDGHILGKPENSEDATRMLRSLSGRVHRVITGICLRTPACRVVDVESTLVQFALLTDEEIAAYVRSGEPMDKAGAYGIQGRAAKFIERIEGCYFNVMGLPVALVYRRLKELAATEGAQREL